MGSFWKGTEWAIHKLLPCTNMGALFKPHLEAVAVSDASSNTRKKKNGQLSCTYFAVFTFRLTGLDATSKACTCPFTDSDMKDSSDMGRSGTRAPLSTGELIESWLFITEE